LRAPGAGRFRGDRGDSVHRFERRGRLPVARAGGRGDRHDRQRPAGLHPDGARAVWQNVEWSHKTARAAPRPVTTLGLGGYWFPLQSRLLTTDGVRLITVKVRAPSTGPAERKADAVALAQVYLGPLRKPAGY